MTGQSPWVISECDLAVLQRLLRLLRPSHLLIYLTDLQPTCLALVVAVFFLVRFTAS